MYGHRVVVTGLGAISPIGLSVDAYWQNLLAGVSGVGRITAFDPEGIPVQIGECQERTFSGESVEVSAG